MSLANLWADCATPDRQREQVELGLARRGLAGDRVGPREAERGGDPAVELADLRAVAEELEERRLRAGGALGAAQQEAAELSTSRRSRSASRSASHRQARLPTVVGCAGWKWVWPRQGRSRCGARELGERAPTTPAPRSSDQVGGARAG